MTTSTPILITFIIYIATIILINLITYLHTKNLSDYILNDHNLDNFVTTLSTSTSNMND